MRRLQTLVLAFGIVVLTAGAALAQSVGATNGAINGKVTDASAGVMPGVTVTITSPSMQGTRTAVTNEEGTYRFPAIPPGDTRSPTSSPASRLWSARGFGSASASLPR